jgi:LysR family transcriptional regulator (chromosome initiation inhibitor)
MADFQLEHVRTLVAVADEGTFDGAARVLHITPSAVSQRIKAMEQTAGQLLVRRTTPVTTTPAGDVVLRFARQVELLAADTSKSLRLEEGAGARSLPIAVNADSLATWFLDALTGLDDTDVVFDLQRDDELRTSELLRSGIVLGAVTALPHSVQGCSTDELGVMRYHAACSPAFLEDRLGGEPTIERMVAAPLIDFDHNDTLQTRFLRELKVSRSRPARHRIPTSAEYARAVVAGLGWALLPEQQCLELFERGELVQLLPEHPVDVQLYWQRWNLDSPILNHLTESVIATASRSLRQPQPS